MSFRQTNREKVRATRFLQSNGVASYIFNRERDYRNGHALSAHINSAHKGEFTPACQACREIQAKQASAQRIND